MSEIRHDNEAERALLGMALSGHSVDEAANLLDGSEFYQPRHAAIWASLGRLRETGGVIDPQTLARDLIRAGNAIDPLYIADLLGAAPMVGSPDWYANRIHEEAQFRALASAAAKIAIAAANQGLEWSEAREIARDAFDAVTTDKARHAHARIGDVLPDVLDIADKGTHPALSTPWPDLDRLIGGLAPGRLVVVGARPAVGKSLMGTNLAMHFADHHGHAVLIASMEMDRNEVTQRLLSARARVDLGRLLNSSLTEQEWDQIRELHDQIAALPIIIDDAPRQTVASIRDTAKQVQRERDDLALIVVDYLQLMDAPGLPKGANRAEAIGTISRGLKVLARETGACVVAMAQVNREGVKGGARPGMGDLRESGSIEADANQVIILHRPDDALPEIEVIVDKNRSGPKGVANLRLRGHYATLSNASWTPTGAIA